MRSREYIVEAEIYSHGFSYILIRSRYSGDSRIPRAIQAAFARLCGVAPIPASSGQTHSMRLHRGGDRQANRSLHLIAVCRLRYDERTIDYMTRRQAEGLPKKDVLSCLKRFIAREVFRDLVHDLDRRGT